jgi:hypothetical protein
VSENSEAAEDLVEALAANRSAVGTDVEHEADQVVVRSRTLDALIGALEVALKLARPQQSLHQAEIEGLRSAAEQWRPPAEVAWKPGDVFALPLANGEFAFGRVLDSHYPTCSLYELTSAEAKQRLTEIVGSKVLGHVRVGPDRLFDGRWLIIGNVPLGPVETLKAQWAGLRQNWSGGTGELLEDFANACNGLVPWNVKANERYYDQLLRDGRPLKAAVLAADAREKYRNEHGMNGPI